MTHGGFTNRKGRDRGKLLTIDYGLNAHHVSLQTRRPVVSDDSTFASVRSRLGPVVPGTARAEPSRSGSGRRNRRRGEQQTPRVSQTTGGRESRSTRSCPPARLCEGRR